MSHVEEGEARSPADTVGPYGIAGNDPDVIRNHHPSGGGWACFAGESREAAMQCARAIITALFMVGGVVHAAQADGLAVIEPADVPSSASFPATADGFQSELESRVERLEALTRRESRDHGSGLSGGAELMFFKPCGEAGSNTAVGVGNIDFLPAWRLWGAASNEEGQGLLVRWWQYDQTAFFGQDRFGSHLIFQKLDLEASQHIEFRHWELLVSGGLTYAGNGLQVIDPRDGPSPRGHWRFDGVGVTCGAQVIRQCIRLPAWKLFGTAQWSGVYGNSVIPGGPSPRGYSQPGTCASILECSIGPRWERSVGGGAVLFAGGGAEAQYWTTGLGSTAPFFGFGRLGSFAGDIGLIGLTCNLGVRR